MASRGALVTGADRPIGRALALEAARHGYAVCIQHRGPEADALIAELRAFGAPAAALSCDLAREDEARALVPRAVEALGRPLALLVNAAGPDPQAGWDARMSVHLHAPILLAETFGAQIAEAAQDALVLNLIEPPQTSDHGLAEGGLQSITRTLARTLAPRVRVNGIGPSRAAASPPGKPPPVEQICAAARYLIDAPAVTGQMIALDSPD